MSGDGRGQGEGAATTATARPGKPSSLLDSRIYYCGDCLEQLAKLPPASVDLISIDPPFNSNRNYEAPGGRGKTKEKRAIPGVRTATPPTSGGRRTSTPCAPAASNPPDFARFLRKTGSFYDHCDWHAPHYVKVMLDETGQVFESKPDRLR